MDTPRRMVLLTVTALVLAVVSAGTGLAQSLFNEGPPIENPADFVDKWIINGNAIGNAVGAVAGQFLFSAALGPSGWVLGSVVGGIAGGFLGEWIDNRIYRSYNYAAFNRPALGDPGALVLEDAGPMEQLLYQLDSRVLIGGNVTTLVTHFGLNMIMRAAPGGLALLNPVTLALADYVAGILGDNVDGLMDLSAIGAHLDRERGFEKGASDEKGWEIYRGAPPSAEDLYRATVASLRSETPNHAEAARLLEAYGRARSD